MIKEGAHVSILVREGSDLSRIADVLQDVDMLKVDSYDSSSVLAVTGNQSWEAIAHLGWQGVTSRDKDEIFQLTGNLDFLVTLLTVSERCGARVFMGLGSQAEYGNVEGRVREDCPASPVTLYGKAKDLCRQTAASFCDTSGIRFCWLRFFSLYGPGERPPWLIPSLIQALHRGEHFPMTSCEQARDYLYIDDASRALAEALRRDTVRGVYNVASGDPVRLREIVETVESLTGGGGSVGIGEIPQRGDQPGEIVADIERFTRDAGWVPQMDLDSGLELTVKSMLADAE